MIVFDLDGTLRDIRGCEHTIPEDTTKNENWPGWQRWVNSNGKPVKSIVALFESFAFARNYEESFLHEMVVLTSSQFGTRNWMIDNIHSGLFDFDGPNPEVIEREIDDHRHPHDYKRAWIDQNKEDIQLWVDDDKVILDYVESLGIPVIRVSEALYA